MFFPQTLQKIFFLPFPYMSYVPVMVFTGILHCRIRIDIPVIVGIQGLAVCITILLSEVIYRRL